MQQHNQRVALHVVMDDARRLQVLDDELATTRLPRGVPAIALWQLDSALVRELAGLKQDRAHLAAELERLSGEKVALEGFTDEVAGRLEGAIREIRAVLSH